MVKREWPKILVLLISFGVPRLPWVMHGSEGPVRGQRCHTAGPSSLLNCGQTNFQAWFEVLTFTTVLLQVN